MKIIKKIAITILLLVIGFGYSIAQQPTSPLEKMSSSIQISVKKHADKTRHILLKVTAKNAEGKREPAPNVKLNLYIQNLEVLDKTDNCITDNEGNAELVLSDKITPDKERNYSLVVKIENNEKLENAEESIHFQEADLSIKLDPKDDSRQVIANVVTTDMDGKKIPVKDITVKFYIQRLFGQMAATEDNSSTTDEAGNASFNYPKEIPGGGNGELTIVARIEDNEQFGTLESNSTVNWGFTIPSEKNPFPRALWEPYAPPSLIIVLCVLFGGVWITYSYIFYHLHKIKNDKNPFEKEVGAWIKQN